MKKEIFNKIYSSEEICDIEGDIFESINNAKEIPIDEHGFQKGSFKIIIEWDEEE